MSRHIGIVALTFFVASIGAYYPYDYGYRGCPSSNCQRPQFCPPCPASQRGLLGPSSGGQRRRRLPRRTCVSSRREFAKSRKLPDVGVVNEGSANRKYPQARIFEIDGGFAQPGEDAQIEEEVTSEPPFYEHTPPQPPPVPENAAADVVEAEAESQRLPPYLNRIFKVRASGVRSRFLRKAPFKCNDERLRLIMHQSMDASDLTSSKRLIVNEAERVLFGKFNVICSPTRLSYVANTRKYCEVVAPEIVCLAFMS
ncbi:hypothetical protein L596_027746 [Steinernema carpocapsae]|uniref:Ground-like domain-containing protein n=1 Tax=Steinernema carpocapsae TaxID=34508 RepID=A0A4U5LWF7_STECR|nr:hypothetical protein L596_027746 [Steinernema carpocapsae]